MFRPLDTSQNPVSAVLDQDGKYEAIVPAGEVKITVDNRSLKSPPRGPVGVSGNPEGDQRPAGVPKNVPVAPPKGAMGEATRENNAPPITPQTQVGKYVPIPEKYYDPDTSGLSLKVTRGSQPFNIELVK
jgi:hypothetical protein